MRELLGKVRKKVRTVLLAIKNDGFEGLYAVVRQFVFRKIHNRHFIAEDTGMLLGENNNDGYVQYDSEYQDDMRFDDCQTDVKMLAFYLPQFHTFPENDAWWGEGFTEWQNTKACTEPRFEGQYQPRTPHADFGYYDLSDIEVLRKQALLAQKHGIYGFCFYYYWFSGKRLMEKPLDQLLQHPEVELPFCLCWANENWTRAWDGQTKNVLMVQGYSEHDDEQFMRDMKKYIDDSRYIRINGKPLVIVYNPGQIPSCEKTFAMWRRVAREISIGEILIWCCATSNSTVKTLGISRFVDAEVEFPPHNMWFDSIGVRGLEISSDSALVYNYQRLVQYQETILKKQNNGYPVPVHHGLTMAWDNSARRKNNWFCLYAFSLRHLYRWTRAIVQRTRKDFALEERFAFINAWNEWAEGTYLEPDEKYGYANINTVSKALFDLPYDTDLQIINTQPDDADESPFEHGQDVRIALQIHMFYLETLAETIQSVNQMPYAFDCYLSTDTVEKQQAIRAAFEKDGAQCYLQVDVYENCGRDVAPFLEQMADVVRRYDYIGHIHSKMTQTSDYGNEWRVYNFRHLLGGDEYLRGLFRLFEQEPKLGLVFPPTYPVIVKQAIWGGNYEGCQALLKECGYTAVLPALPVFPVGNMFWARVDAVLPFFDGRFSLERFPSERGQTNATIAHCIERSWVYLARRRGYHHMRVWNNCEPAAQAPVKRRLILYVHYSADPSVSREDMHFVRVLSTLKDALWFISNSEIDADSRHALEPYADEIMIRPNQGYDFGAWRDAIAQLDFSDIAEYDEIILANNSIITPYENLNRMFVEMEKRQVDFWGPMLFPYNEDGSYLNMHHIPEHLQSYFLVFSKKAFASTAFRQFWNDLPDAKDLKEAIITGEVRLTTQLAQAGLTYDAYLKESRYLNASLGVGDVPYEFPWLLLILGMPFLKKKHADYASDEEKMKVSNFYRVVSNFSIN